MTPFRFDRDTGWPTILVSQLHHEIRVLDCSPFVLGHSTGWPNVDVTELDQEIRIEVELPGFDEKDVNVELSNNVLIIEGGNSSTSEDSERPLRQRRYGRFERRIPLEWNVEEDNVVASFRNGALTITLPRSLKGWECTKRIPINGR